VVAALVMAALVRGFRRHRGAVRRRRRGAGIGSGWGGRGRRGGGRRGRRRSLRQNRGSSEQRGSDESCAQQGELHWVSKR
jgi:hypothetical protein